MKKSSKNQSQKLASILASLVIIVISIISFAKQGVIGMYIDKIMRYLFGQFHFVIYIILILMSLYTLFLKKIVEVELKNKIGYVLLLIAFLLISASFNTYGLIGLDAVKYFFNNSKDIFNYIIPANGGLFGILVYGLFTAFVGTLGTYLFLPIIIIIGFVLAFDYKDILKKYNDFKNKRLIKKLKKEEAREEKQKVKQAKQATKDAKKQEKTQLLPVKNKSVLPQEKAKSIFIDLDKEKVDVANKVNTSRLNHIVDGKKYTLPPLSLLDTNVASTTSSKNKNSATLKGDKLLEVLNEFNIEAELVDIHIGPSVTKFEIRPETSVKVSKISSIQDNIKMELAAKTIRIEAPIPGKNTVGIEIPNIKTTPVKLYELLKDMPKDYNNNPLMFTLGKDLMGQTVFSDLTKMPHLLIAGATGAGKSVAMNAIITTILLRTTPAEVRLLLIDPKKVEFANFSHVPHLLTDIITEPSKANNALSKVVEIMDERYGMFAEVGVKNIASYKQYIVNNPDKKLKDLELIVVIIDELADLMVVAGKEVEQSIQRITQLARAAGIHLIVATQRPSTDVITGIIKANIPSRISFAVSSGIDSRTILDAVGAEKLLGNGDMLYYPVTNSAPLRLQGVYVSDSEVSEVANFVSKGPSPDYFEEFTNLDENGDLAMMPMAFDDPLYEDVKLFVVREQKASTSLIQRSFGIGYNRAARIIDALESKEIIGPMQGSKPRDVFITEKDIENNEI